MRCHGFFAVANAFANHVSTHQTGDSGVDVHHGAASEIECAFGPQPTSSSRDFLQRSGVGDGVRTVPIPNHVGHGQVAESEPQGTEQQNGRELHAFSKRANDQGASDGGEGGLEGHESQLRDVNTFAKGGAQGFNRHAFEQEFVKGAEERIAGGEGDRVAVQHPQHINHRRHHKHLHQHRQHVFRADQAAVEQGQTGDGHEDDQHGGHGHPSGVAFVGHRGRCGLRCSRFGGGRCRRCNGSGFSRRFGGRVVGHGNAGGEDQAQAEGQRGK